jgi:ribonucleoside-diphosphate reductase alpha chain
MRIKSVKPIEDKDDFFYDLNVFPNNNYVLGNGSVVHNTGFNFSKIRPSGSLVNSTKGVASGVVSFMSVFDAATHAVKQGGVRRGANLGLLNINHPEIVDFINCKKDTTKFQNFNISIGLDGDFLSKAKKGTKYHLVNPHTKKRTEVDASEIFDLICMNIHENGEPGILFLDTMNKMNPIPWMGRIENVNPCIAGSTLIHTTQGKIPIKDLVGKSPWIFCSDGKAIKLRQAKDVRCTRKNAEVYKLCYKDGWNHKFEMVATPEHKFMMRDGSYKKLEELKVGDSLMPFLRLIKNHKVISIEKVENCDVFNMEVDDYHNFAANGLVIHNCGEMNLLPWESCNLGSIDVSKFCKDGDVDWGRLLKVVEIAVRFLDDVIDVNHYPRVKIARKTLATRKIGLGVMGWADLLIELKIRYDSEEALVLAEKLMSTINNQALRTSEQLGKEKGMCPAGNGKLKRRNAVLTVIAPTGTLSMLAGCSSSIEPLFAKNFTKTVLGNIKLDMSKKHRGNNGDCVVTALEIKPEWHVKMQAAFQKYTSGAVSKTINLPHDATIEDVRSAIYQAYDLGCKGLTLYRNGTREAPMEIVTEGLSECDGGKCQI